MKEILKKYWFDITGFICMAISGYFVFSKCYADNIWKFIFSTGVIILYGSLHYTSYKEPKEYHVIKVRHSSWDDSTKFTDNLNFLRSRYFDGKYDSSISDPTIVATSVKYYSDHVRAQERAIAVFGSTKAFAEYYRNLPPYYANKLLHDILDDHQTVLFLKDSQWDYKEEGLTESEIKHYEDIRYKLIEDRLQEIRTQQR